MRLYTRYDTALSIFKTSPSFVEADEESDLSDLVYRVDRGLLRRLSPSRRFIWMQRKEHLVRRSERSV